MTQSDDPLDALRRQYEALPYPDRDPAEEARRLVTGSPSHWPEVVHHLFAGRPPGGTLRILVAGCGTGDALTMLAQQTADAGLDVEITALDLSEASIAIARARIEARGLEARVRFMRRSLLEAPEIAAAEGGFDYIDCCGVLHHLSEPSAGFRALAEALKPRGGLGLMVYGEFGRTGVYEMQEALRALIPGDAAPVDRAAAARAVLDHLPETNRLRCNPLIKDHLDSDAGLFDLLLHSSDRAYRADTLMAEMEGAGLRHVCWIDPLRYDPALYLPEGQARDRAAALPPAGRAALAEALAGNMRKHIAYAVRADRPDDPRARMTPEAVPVFRDAATMRTFHAMPEGAPSLPITIDGLSLHLPLPGEAAPLLRAIDGKRGLEKIRKQLPDRPDKATFKRRFEAVFQPLNGFSKLFLRR
ncbi:class I SAM-dependent methyltransferase [Marivibrio halodurans]|uniref:Class I SAM-dependent methyltransferase n=1 Tax=Marivibrio halodurans TaxID=2039722 RepID=A0A8J7SPH4_9PROT|nr:class I SAM-dependent methyltransferase [Marivibrio halodurans]MBP5858633.1 class I SAM-dependent methyltransferase [Marivibrio halodurans]